MRLFGYLVSLAVCAGASAETPAPATAPESVLTMDRALSLALENHPTLAAFGWELRAADARRLQAGLRPNPDFTLDIEGIRFSPGVGSTTVSRGIGSDGTVSVGRDRTKGAASGMKESQFTIALGQLFELGGKRARRVELASREKALVEWDYQAAKADVLSEVSQVFVEVLAAQESIARAAEIEDLAGRMSKVVQEQVAAGDASHIDALSAEVPVAEAHVAHQQARQALQTARRKLAYLCGVEEAALGAVQGDLTQVESAPTFEDLVARIEENPDLARWGAEMEHRRAALKVETSKRVPDVSIYAGAYIIGVPESRSRGLSVDGPTPFVSAYSSRTKGDDDWETTMLTGISVPIPIFDRNQGGIEEAEHLAAKASEERREVEMAVRTALADAHAALASAYGAIVTLRDTAIPKAEEAYKLTEEGYRSGKFGYLEVLLTEEAVIDLRTQYTSALAEYHSATVDAERLIGGPLNAG